MIKIEVTGSSIAEISDKLLAIGASLQRTASYTEDNAAREALQAKRNAVKVEVAEAATANPTEPAPSAESCSEVATAASPSVAIATSHTDPLNFDTDVAPIVLMVVKDKGKPLVQAILAEFGVERASTLDPALWPELIAKLQEAF